MIKSAAAANLSRSLSPAVHSPIEALILRLQAVILSHDSLEFSATAFCADVAQTFKCERVSIGLAHEGVVKLIATSSVSEVLSRSEVTQALTLAMHEAFDQKSTVAFPPPPSSFPFITLAQQRLVSGNVDAVYSVPLMNSGRIVGVLTVERNTQFAEWESAAAEDIASFSAPLFELKRAAEKSWSARLTSDVRDFARALRAPGHAGSKFLVAICTLVICGATLIPFSYRISAPARLEGSVQRIIVAPADGFLRQANVRAGDRVKEGQVLAEMASEDLQLEKARRESELRQHEDAYKTALARSDRAQMVIHQSKAGEAQAMLSLAQAQLDRSQIQAPFDGVVIKGDLTQNLGAPVQRGEALLTVAPGNSFRAIVEVDETDIAAVKTGQHGRLVLAAEPDKQLELTVNKIIPVATSADARNYFEIEASLAAGSQALRPGLRGIAKIDVGSRNLLWIVGHRPAGWLRYWFWSIGL